MTDDKKQPMIFNDVGMIYLYPSEGPYCNFVYPIEVQPLEVEAPVYESKEVNGKIEKTLIKDGRYQRRLLFAPCSANCKQFDQKTKDCLMSVQKRSTDDVIVPEVV